MFILWINVPSHPNTFTSGSKTKMAMAIMPNSRLQNGCPPPMGDVMVTRSTHYYTVYGSLYRKLKMFRRRSTTQRFSSVCIFFVRCLTLYPVWMYWISIKDALNPLLNNLSGFRISDQEIQPRGSSGRSSEEQLTSRPRCRLSSCSTGLKCE